MRLSLPMIADRIPQFAPEVVASKRSRSFRNARLLSDSQIRSRSTLYLQQNDPATVICTSGTDMMTLRCDDVDHALNDILDVFDYFNEWASQVDELIRNGATAASVVERIADELDMQVILADATYLIHEYATGKTPFIDPVLDSYLEDRSMPLDVILQVESNPHVRSPQAGVYYVKASEQLTSAVGNIFVDGVHLGWLVVSNGAGSFTQGNLDFIDAAKEKIEFWMRINQQRDENWEQAAVFVQLARGDNVNEDIAKRALSVFGWSDGDSMQVIAVQPGALPKSPDHIVERFIQRLNQDAFSVRVADSLMVVANEAKVPMLAFLRDLEDILRTCGYIAGVGPSFTNIMDLRSHYDAARIAAESADEETRIVSFEDIKLAYALSVLQRNTIADVRHRALACLRDYDAQHDTQLYDTLRCFIECRGSYVQTYKSLFIHRSTLLYRLERIGAIASIDLNDPETWTHLMLSFLLDE